MYKTRIYQNLEDPNLYQVEDIATGRTGTIRATPEQFKELLARLGDDVVASLKTPSSELLRMEWDPENPIIIRTPDIRGKITPLPNEQGKYLLNLWKPRREKVVLNSVQAVFDKMDELFPLAS